MPRYIRYMEDGVYKYASVKDVGDLQNLMTTNKTDIVSAINELLGSGGADQETHDRLVYLETISAENASNITTQQGVIDMLVVDFGDLEAEQARLQETATQLRTDVDQAKTDITNKADLTYVNGELVKKIDLSKYDTEYSQVKADLLEKVDSTRYQTEYESITTALSNKVENTNFNNLSGKVDTIERDVVDLETEVSTRITRTQFDDAVGVNQWVKSKYVTTGTDLVNTPPSFGLIKGMIASQADQVIDANTLTPFSGAGVITHFFTNVKLELAKTITLNIRYKDSIGVYMNGAKIYENKSNNLTPVSVSLSLRAGWNTIEILHGSGGTSPLLELGTTISTQVQKMTTVIGVGDKNETRLTQTETEIKQTQEEISLKADKTEVTNIGNRVTANEASITVLNDEIASKVEQTDFDAYSQRLTNAESSIVQNADSIKQKVGVTEYNLLNEKVTSQGTEISQLKDQIILKVSSEDFDGLAGRVSTAESQITLNKNAIALKAEQTALDAVDGRLKTAEGSLTVANDQIALRVKQADYDTAMADVTSRLSTAETSITQTATDIALKADKSTTYTKNEIDSQLGDIELQISDANTAITQNATNINLKANSKDVYTITQSNNLLAGKTNNSDFNALVTRVSTAESEIDQTSEQIALRVTKTEFDALNIDGRNLLRNSAFLNSATGWVNTSLGSIVTDGGKKFYKISGQLGVTKIVHQSITGIKPNTKYSLSALLKVANRVQGTTNPHTQLYVEYYNKGAYVSGQGGIVLDKNMEATRLSRVFTTISGTFDEVRIQMYVRDCAGDFYFTEIKFEESDRPTGWTPSPEEINESIAESVSTAKAEIKITTDGITQNVSSLQSTVNAQGETISSHSSSISQLNSSISLKANSTDVYTKTQVNTELGKKANQTDMTALTTRVSKAEADLTVQSDAITARVTKTEYDTGIADVKKYVDDNTGNLVNNITKTGIRDKWTTGATLDNKDFFGTIVPVLKATSTGDLQVYSDYFSVDPSKAYEVTLWYQSDADTGSDYFGLHAYDEATVTNVGIDMINNTSGGVSSPANTNPYFWSGAGSSHKGQWVRRTAYIMPAGTTASDMKGIGTNVSTNARMLATTRKIRIRFLNYYNNGVSKTLWIANPKVVEVDPNAVISGAKANDYAGSLDTRLSTAETKITTNAIVSTVTNSSAWTNQASQITQTADKVSIVVGTDNKIKGSAVATAITADSTAINLISENINLTGKVTISSLDNTTRGVLANAEANLINSNPYFLDWSGTYPAGFNSVTGTGMSKVASGNGMGNAVQYVVGAGGNHYLNPIAVTTQPFHEYIVVETTFMLKSGTIDGAGVLFRYNRSGTQTDHKIHFKDFIPSPVLNKWYTITTTIKQANLTDFTSYSIFPMGGWGSLGTVTAKTIQFDSVKTRPASKEEINAYNSWAEIQANSATWDRAVNIRSDGKIDTSKLYGTVADSQVASSSKWNTASADVDRWKMTGKTTIDGGNIETDTIKVTKLSALSTDLGTVNAGTINGVTINGGIINSIDSSNSKNFLKIQNRKLTAEGETGASGTNRDYFTTTIDLGQISGTYGKVSTSNARTKDGSWSIDRSGVFFDQTGVGNVLLDMYSLNFTSTSSTDIGWAKVERVLTDLKLEARGNVEVHGNGGRNMRFVGDDHVYMEFYNKGRYGGRGAYFGFGSGLNENFTVRNERGKLYLGGVGGTVVDDLTVDNDVSVKESGTFSSRGGYVVLRSQAGGYVYSQGSELRVTTVNATGYVPCRASSFPTGSSIRYKDNLVKVEDVVDALGLVKGHQIWQYHLKSNLEMGIYDKPKFGIIAEMASPYIRDEDGIDSYGMVAIAWKAIQQQAEIIQNLEIRIADLEALHV